jgi:hypothetical protein
MSATSCLTCNSGERGAIEHSRASGATLGKLSKRFSLSKASLQRHFSGDHVAPALRDKQKAIALVGSECDLKILREQEQDGLLRHVASQRGKLYGLLDRAEDLGDIKTAAQVHGRITQNLRLGADVLGMIGASTTTINQSLVISPDYLRLRSALLQALGPFREARLVVAAALRTIEAAPQPEPEPQLALGGPVDAT